MAIHDDTLSSARVRQDDVPSDRLIAPASESKQEEALERALRPKQLDEYIGQEKIRGQLSIFIEAARSRPIRRHLITPRLIAQSLDDSRNFTTQF